MKNIILAAFLLPIFIGCASQETVKTDQKENSKSKKKVSAENSFQSGIDAYKVRDYEKAKGLLLKSVGQKHSKNELLSLHKHLGFIYAIQGNPEASYKEFMKAFKLDKSFELDKSESGHPSWTPAFERANKESALLSAKGSELFNSGKEYYNNRDYANATIYLGAAVSKDDLKSEKKVEAYKLLAFVYAIEKKTAQARGAFMNAFKVDSGFQLDKSEYGNPTWTPIYDEAKKQSKKK